MKHVYRKLCRASVAAAGVMVATSAASAETKPLEFETEFDLGAAGVRAGVSAALAMAEAQPAAQWEDSITAYLDGLIEKIAPVVEPPPAPAAGDAAVEALIDAEIAAFAAVDPVTPAAEVTPLPAELLELLGVEADGDEADDAVTALAQARAEIPALSLGALTLAPVPSHPLDCDQCHAAGEWIEVKMEEQVAAPADGMVDDAAAWQKLAEWASARLAAETKEDVADDVELAEFELLFGDPTLAD